ncbi:hypothetical protein SCAR479_07574 [Seiridium cardinale]|uniref:Uncharacterized protein n=1 Tax=Seiridium cardinale TaxID=138064 RepID=A0ABR2XPM4_9PEZI
MSDNVSVVARLVPERKHTRSRPPSLNQKNFSSTQADGPANEPTPPTPRASPCPSVAGIEHDLRDLVMDENAAPVARYPPSLDTDSTMSAGAYTITNQDLKHRAEFIQLIDWQLKDHSVAQRQSLTELALHALDYGNSAHGYHRDLAGWCKDGNIFIRDDPRVQLTGSMLMSQRARSRATDQTSSSWSMLSDARASSLSDDTAGDVSGTGAAFFDVPRPFLDEHIDLLGSVM